MTPAMTRLVEQAQAISATATAVLTTAPMPLQPHTARLCQQAIRLSKGIQSAVQTWVIDESQARGSAGDASAR